MTRALRVTAQIADGRAHVPDQTALNLVPVEPNASDAPMSRQASTASEPYDCSIHWKFPATPVHARMAHKWTEEWLADLWPNSDAAATAALVVSEVVGNAVIHGTGPITVAARADDEVLHCEVSDQSPLEPEARVASPEDVGGRGLQLIAALIVPGSWSVNRRPSGGKAIAFEVSSQSRPFADFVLDTLEEEE